MSTKAVLSLAGEKKSKKKAKPPKAPSQVALRRLLHPRLESPLVNGPIKVRRLVPSGFYYPSTTVPTFNASVFRLSDVPGYTEFTAAYDQYRLVGVCMVWKAMCNAQPLQSTNTFTDCYVLTAVDYDDGTAPTSLNQLREYSTCEIHAWHESFVVALKPKLAMAVYQPSTFSAYAQAPDGLWVDCASASAEYYGVKSGFNAVTTGHVNSWYVEYVTEWEFRLVR